VDAATHQQECSKCHHILTEAHGWNAGEITTPATHLAVGEKTFTCTACGETRTEEIPKDPTHTYSAWEKQDAEQHTRVCACGDMQSAAHEWDAGTVTTPATYFATGVRSFSCSGCGFERTEEIPKMAILSPEGWILPTLIAGIVLCIGILILILVLKRRKKRPTPTAPPTPEGVSPKPEAAVTEPMAKEADTVTEASPEASADPAAEPPAGEGTEESAQEPIEEPIEEPTEEPIEESIEEPIEEPIKEPAEESLQEPIQDLPKPDADEASAGNAPSDAAEEGGTEPSEALPIDADVPDKEADDRTEEPRILGEQEESK
jgi:rubredoxin